MVFNPQNNILITVIVAVFNNSSTLQRCIDSIFFQTYSYKELIIIDGGSTDGTVEIIKSNHQKITYWESEKDKGIYHAFNKGVLKANGEWIIFLGSDDYLWNSDVLTKVAQEIAQLDSEIRIVYGKVARISAKNELLEIVNQSWEKSRKAFRYYDNSNIDHQGVFHNRKIFSLYGLFDESFKICGDYDLMLRELKDRDAIFLSEDIIVAGRQIGGISNQYKNMLQTYRECEKARQKNYINNLFFLHFKLYFYLKEFIRIFLLFVIGEKYMFIVTDLYRIITLRLPIWTKL